jgi:hypothetical protein
LNGSGNPVCQCFGFLPECRCRFGFVLPELCDTLRNSVEFGYKLGLPVGYTSCICLLAEPQISSGLIYPLQLKPM